MSKFVVLNKLVKFYLSSNGDYTRSCLRLLPLTSPLYLSLDNNYDEAHSQPVGSVAHTVPSEDSDEQDMASFLSVRLTREWRQSFDICTVLPMYLGMVPD